MQTHDSRLVPSLAIHGGNANLTMSSEEIADVCGARHNDVVETIERLFGKGVLRESRKTTRRVKPKGGGRPKDVYDLTKRDSLVVVSGYDDEVRAKLIDRWIELETTTTSAVSLPDFTNPAAAARAFAEQYEARMIAERTKAEIGSRREATAMATASRKAKEVLRLQAQLDGLSDWATVKRMEKFYKRDFPWHPLKKASKKMGAPINQVTDINYGLVNAYHADVWREVYGVEIPSGEDA